MLGLWSILSDLLQEKLRLVGWVGLGWVGLGWVGLGWVGLIGLDWVGLGWVGLLLGIHEIGSHNSLCLTTSLFYGWLLLHALCTCRMVPQIYARTNGSPAWHYYWLGSDTRETSPRPCNSLSDTRNEHHDINGLICKSNLTLMMMMMIMMMMMMMLMIMMMIMIISRNAILMLTSFN